MVFQSYALFPNMTVAGNLGFGLKIRGAGRAEIDEKVTEVARVVGLSDHLQKRPGALSGGQRQRVALARAIVRQPNVFLMDEPLSNLDAKLRVSTRAQIKNLSHELKVTTIYVTHDQIEAMTLADRVVVMNKGVVQQVATPTEIYDFPANTFVAGFIGNPAMNLMQGDLKGGTFTGTRVTISGLKGPDGPVTLGFRAEDASLADKGEIVAPIYSLELLGDATMITVKAGGTLVSIKAPKDFRAEIGDQITAAVPVPACHLFDAGTGDRLAV
jgi:multiple sugar transport system ATP-binding protein